MEFKKAKAEALCFEYCWEANKKSKNGICSTLNVCLRYITIIHCYDISTENDGWELPLLYKKRLSNCEKRFNFDFVLQLRNPDEIRKHPA